MLSAGGGSRVSGVLLAGFVVTHGGSTQHSVSSRLPRAADPGRLHHTRPHAHRPAQPCHSDPPVPSIPPQTRFNPTYARFNCVFVYVCPLFNFLSLKGLHHPTPVYCRPFLFLINPTQTRSNPTRVYSESLLDLQTCSFLGHPTPVSKPFSF